MLDVQLLTARLSVLLSYDLALVELIDRDHANAILELCFVVLLHLAFQCKALPAQLPRPL